MKKIFKKSNIFAFILGTVIFTGITGVAAYTILANDIGYTPKDSTWKKSNGEDITNVKDAIDELYNKTIEYYKKDITNKVTQNNQCYDSVEVNVLDMKEEKIMVISLSSNVVTQDCNPTYTIDVSDLNINNVISYSHINEGYNSGHFAFRKESIGNNTMQFEIDTNFGYSTKYDIKFKLFVKYN